MIEQIIPLEHVVYVTRNPMFLLNDERYFVVAQAWSPAELDMISVDDDAFGYALVKIDSRTGKGLPREYAPLPTIH